MKKIFYIVFLITFCMVHNSSFANEDEVLPDEQNSDEITNNEALDKESFLKDRKKHKKKKGERNVKVQPSQEDDENIILELDNN